MKNLKILNLVELNAQEVSSINGGSWTWFAGQIIDHWNEIKRGLSDGWNGTYNPQK